MSQVFFGQLLRHNGPREWRTPAAGDVQRGMALYQARCTACHAVAYLATLK
ncbi:MAG: hypothetical protein Q8O29_00020 [Polaromonas sp.]|uniref:hypothetical protein n=1 Tax=Polaromonas sp. TaxID=1869339 RepID=UPI002733A4EC|nr:hypothetical protein [Polaromonas sp.]MDP2816672.1 hypothetical protein [Polaromonas sp.]